MNNLDALRQKLENANASHQAGNLAAAIPIYREVLNLWPDQPDALHMLGVIAQQMGNIPLALQLFDETIRVVPQFAIAWVNRAIAQRMLGKNDDSRQSIEQALRIQPDLASAWNMSGILLRDERKYDEALQKHIRAVELEPNNANFQQNYAAVLLSCSKVQEAYKAARIAEKLNPDRADTLTVLGNILVASGYPEKAIPCYHKAQTLDPRYVDSVIAEATTCLFMGDFARGWELMEKRRLYLHDNRCQTLPRWDGTYVDHLLLAAEQGAGDNIQSLRYIPFLKSRVGHITVQMPAHLKKLVQSAFPDIPVITSQDPLPSANAFEPLMSLAFHCAQPSHEIPAALLLKSEEEWWLPWHERLKDIPKPRIGFSWAGNRTQINDYNRSMPFDAIKPLIEQAKRHAVSVQKDRKPDNLSGCFDTAPWLDDYAATAGLLHELDLLITVDTSVAHLMGALGKPVWVLLPFDPGWRYLIGCEDSLWYPTMRLFRQSSPGDWTSVITQVSGELKKYLSGDRTVLDVRRHQGPFLRQAPNALQLQD